MIYLPRVVDSEIDGSLGSAGAVLIDGAKACGKTMTARQVGRSEALLDTDPLVEQQMQVDPRLVLSRARPRACSTSGRSSLGYGTTSAAPWTTGPNLASSF